jgi:N-acetylneuraminic acid mutarotase
MRHSPLHIASATLLTLLGLGACHGDTSPTGPAGEAVVPAPALDVGNLVSDTWATRPQMPMARMGLVAATVNGVIYAIGGKNASHQPVAKVQAYYPDADLVAWRDKAPLPAARSHASGAAVINGRIYVTGGLSANGEATRSLFMYNVANNSWTSKAKIPVPSVAGASAAIDGKLYVLSGARPGDPRSKLHRYDPGTNTWTSRAPAPANLAGAVVGVINGKLYAAGGAGDGTGPLSTLHVYNPSTNTWTTKAAMPAGKVAAAGRVLGGKLYVVGGSGAGPYGMTQVYSPGSNSWTTKTQMLTPRHSAAAAAAGGILHVLGGTPNSGIESVATNEVYIP